MTFDKRPIFLNNESWFVYDEEKRIYVLTKEATKEAKESYKEFYGLLNTL